MKSGKTMRPSEPAMDSRAISIPCGLDPSIVENEDNTSVCTIGDPKLSMSPAPTTNCTTRHDASGRRSSGAFKVDGEEDDDDEVLPEPA
jgi:hypothetical protein